MLESGTTVETETRDAGYDEFNRQHVTRLARWVVTWCTVDCTDRAFWKRLSIEAGRSFRIFVVPNTDRVLGHCALWRFRFRVMREVVENGLPPALLLLDGMRRLAVEGDADGDAFQLRGKALHFVEHTIGSGAIRGRRAGRDSGMSEACLIEIGGADLDVNEVP